MNLDLEEFQVQEVTEVTKVKKHIAKLILKDKKVNPDEMVLQDLLVILVPWDPLVYLDQPEKLE